MPGLPLTGEYERPEAPRILYASAGADRDGAEATEATAPGADATMAYAARRAAAKPGAGWALGPPSRVDRAARSRWRVARLRDDGVVVAVVADERFPPRALEAFARRVGALVAPLVAGGGAATVRALVERELGRVNAERRGLAAPTDAAAACGACGAARSARTRLVACAACGDAVCARCAPAEDGVRACGDCAWQAEAGRRLLRLRPPSAGGAARAFALRALFDERARDGVLDGAAFRDFCRAAARHPLVADARALEREAACEDAFELDAAALDAAFEARGGPLDVEGAAAALAAACAPAWPRPPDDDDDNTKGESAADALARYASMASQALGGLFSPKAKTATKTGWASIGGRRKWLALDRSELRAAADPNEASRLLARLDRVRQARRDASLEITLRVSDDQRRGADGVVLKFDTPSKCVAWWTALSRARLEALGERGWQSALYESVATEKPFLGFGGDNSSTTARATDDSLPEKALSMAGPDAKAAYQALLKVIIRPPRATYDEKRLGLSDFSVLREWRVHREDFVVRNDRGLEVRASLWAPSKKSDTPPPCVVYAHGNACNRLGALSLLRPLCVGGVALCALDCAGSGNSGGEFVSLGFHERDDVFAVVDYLRRRALVSRVALWGRSAGASASILYAATRDPDVAGVVADSPFASLERLCRELVAKTAATSGHAALAVGAATEAALAVVGASVRHRAGFDLAKVAPVDHVGALRHCGTPLLLIHGARDDFIHPDHSRDLLAAHGGDAELVLVDRDHQAPRPASCIARACLFCYDRLFDQVDARRQAYARRLDQLAADGLLEDEAESSGMTRDRQRNVIRTARLVRGQRAEA